VSGQGKADRQAARERAALGTAGEYLLACLSDDQRGIDEAVSRVDGFALNAALLSITQGAVAALAEERGASPGEVVASLIADLS
jgi:hypothetical protein